MSSASNPASKSLSIRPIHVLGLCSVIRRPVERKESHLFTLAMNHFELVDCPLQLLQHVLHYQGCFKGLHNSRKATSG